MRNEIKISFNQPKYKVDSKNGITTCRLTFVPQFPPFIQFILNNLYNNNFPTTFCVIAKTRAKKGDPFNENGYKVSLAKAENKAYRAVRNLLKSFYNELHKADHQIATFSHKVESVINHNINYMNQF